MIRGLDSDSSPRDFALGTGTPPRAVRGGRSRHHRRRLPPRHRPPASPRADYRSSDSPGHAGFDGYSNRESKENWLKHGQMPFRG